MGGWGGDIPGGVGQEVIPDFLAIKNRLFGTTPVFFHFGGRFFYVLEGNPPGVSAVGNNFQKTTPKGTKVFSTCLFFLESQKGGWGVVSARLGGSKCFARLSRLRGGGDPERGGKKTGFLKKKKRRVFPKRCFFKFSKGNGLWGAF